MNSPSTRVESGESQNAGRYLTFTVGGEVFGVGSNSVLEVVEFPKVTNVPLVPDVVVGVINIRGVIAPVIDLNMRIFGKKSEIGKSSRVLLFEFPLEEGGLIGALVEAVNAIETFGEGELDSNPGIGSKINPAFIEGVGRVQNGFIVLLNIKKLIDNEDLMRLVGSTDFTKKLVVADSGFEASGAAARKGGAAEEEIELEMHNFISLFVAGDLYAVDMDRVEEIISMGEITPLPNTMPYMKGVIEFREKAIPLVDMRLRCGLEEKKYDRKTPVVVVRMRGSLVGMAVDGTSDLIRLPVISIQDVQHYPLKIDRDFVRGIARHEDRFVIVLNVDRILTEDEIQQARATGD